MFAKYFKTLVYFPKWQAVFASHRKLDWRQERKRERANANQDAEI
jgi:hypothetical protein